MTDYRQLLSNIQTRHNPEKQISVESKMLSGLPIYSNDIQQYVYMAMMAVDDEYTSKTKEAGQRVKDHLLNGGLSNVSYHYQGSVMTDTHIKGHSDIDLLVICNKYYTYDAQNVQQILANNINYSNFQLSKLRTIVGRESYQGNSLEDLRSIRLESENILYWKYDICDLTHPKAIKITNQNLHRDVDIVVASWYDDVDSILNDQKIPYRGIQVYDKVANNISTPDYPFLSIDRINERSANTGGRLKRMIRFLKNVKVDSKNSIGISSFDINAICYNIAPYNYNNLHYLELVEVVCNQLYKIVYDESYANRIVSVDGKEYIFKGNNKRVEIKKLYQDVFTIYSILKTQNLL